MTDSTRRSWLSHLGLTGIGALFTAPWTAAHAGAAAGGVPTEDQDAELHEHDRWLARLTAPHRQVIDIVQPVGTSGFNYALTFLYANVEAYRRRDSDVNVVVVLRDRASVLALGDTVWQSYRIGEHFGITDPETKAPALRNIHANRGQAAANLSAAIDALQDRGVSVVACGTALRTYAAQTARRANMDAAAAREAWLAAVLPRVHVVPAGILAVHAAQRRGFAYAVGGGA